MSHSVDGNQHGSASIWISYSMQIAERSPLRNRRILFVCLGNACRSQMAEAFAHAHGSDILDVASAGVLPAHRVSRTMQRVMKEKNIEVETRKPQSVFALNLDSFDLIVNLSDYGLPVTTAKVIKIPLRDPVGKGERFQRKIRDEIENIVASLIGVFRGCGIGSPNFLPGIYSQPQLLDW